jgi:hypothetical protein
MILRTSQLAPSHITIATLAWIFHYWCHTMSSALYLSLLQLCPTRLLQLQVQTSPSILPFSLALEASSCSSIHASKPYTCDSNRSAPLLIWKHANSSNANLIMSSHHLLPRHREQQPHQPPHSYVVIADRDIASNHSLTSLLPLIFPPCTKVWSPPS